jgi:hypothetical protein
LRHRSSGLSTAFATHRPLHVALHRVGQHVVASHGATARVTRGRLRREHVLPAPLERRPRILALDCERQLRAAVATQRRALVFGVHHVEVPSQRFWRRSKSTSFTRGCNASCSRSPPPYNTEPISVLFVKNSRKPANPALYPDAPGMSRTLQQKGRASLRRSGKRER